MKIPGRIKVGGVPFEIILRNGTNGESTSYGSCNAGAQKIWVSEAVGKQQQETTLVHEVLEAINTLYELNLEHTQISCLETALYAFIVDNPEVFKK